MAGERHGYAKWPGAISVESCVYTQSHGISPGTAVLHILPQEVNPAMSGDLVITDGIGTILLPDCRLDDLKVEQSENGFTWSLQISDRRWKWRDFGSIAGCYNQLDEVHKKLIPWTIRSPIELARLCLDLMDETGYTIDLPPGFDKATGRAFGEINPPWIGINPGNTNPPVNWTNETPMVALQRLCEWFGRRIIYRIDTNTIEIAIGGRGADLPDGSIAKESPGLSNPQTPSRVAVYGAPTRYQCRLLMQAVGEEWDGSLRPIDQLSYKPLPANGKPQISKAKIATNGTSNSFQIFIGAEPEDPPTTGALFEETGAGSAATIATNLAAKINASADPRVMGKVTADSDSTNVIVTGVTEGVPFTFWAKLSGSPSGTGTVCIVPSLTQAAERPTGGWEYSVPPVFANVRETDRLRRQDALRLAQKHIYKTYQLVGIDAGTRGGPIKIPGYGATLTRRQQVLLTPFQVDQVVPEAIDKRLIGADGLPFLQNFYNGYSRDKPAVCFGSITTIKAGGAANAWWVPGLGLANTDPAGQIYVDFSVDAEQQTIAFSNCVFRKVGAQYLPATPVLQTGVMIRNAESNALEVFILGKYLPGVVDNTNIAVRTYEDVQLLIVGQYDDRHNILGANVLEADAERRAAYYVDGLAAQYITSGSLTREYLGIVPISMDGAICQVTYEVGPNFATTTASRNTEHSLWVPPYPARRRAEFLRPAQQAAIEAAVNPNNLGGSLHTPNPESGSTG